MGKTIDFNLEQRPFENLIINGSLDFWQRGTSVNPIPGGTHTYLADRFSAFENLATGVFRYDRDTDVPDNSVPYSLKLECTTAQASVTGSEVAFVRQTIEGFLARKIRGKRARINFYTKSNFAGTLAFQAKNDNTDRNWFKLFSVSGGELWQKHSIFFEHDETGTWDYGTGAGLRVGVTLAAGPSVLSGGESSWIAGSPLHGPASGFNYNLFGATGRYIKIAKIWMHEGWDDVPYEATVRSYPEELALCQRYYEKSYNLATPPGTNTAIGLNYMSIMQTDGSNASDEHVEFKERKRTAPVISIWKNDGTANVWQWFGVATSQANNSMTITDQAENGFNIRPNGVSTGGRGDCNRIFGHWAADAEF